MGDDSLGTNYTTTYAGHLKPGSLPALLLVDMVQAYTAEGSPFYCPSADAAVQVAAKLADTARSVGRPVIFTKVEYEPGGANGGLFYRKVPALKSFDVGSPLGEFPPALQPYADDLLVTKQYPSAFFGTQLASRLRALGIDTLLIGGFSTSGCVRASAVDALQNEFAPFVVRDACADRHEAPHEANLFDLQAKYAEVISLAEAFTIIRDGSEQGHV